MPLSEAMITPINLNNFFDLSVLLVFTVTIMTPVNTSNIDKKIKIPIISSYP